MLMKLGWQCFDRLCWILAYGSEEQLANFVAKPEEFIEHREDLPVVHTDAVPVYLDTGTGKILVSTRVLDAAARRRLARRHGKEPEELTEDIHICAEGPSRGEKDRLTWICRQVSYNYFKKGTKEEPAPKMTGAMLISIILVHCATFVQLELICPATDTWLKTHQICINGRTEVRKAGDPVPKNLLKAWRELRAKYPEMFEKGVKVWGSPNAYQNEVVCEAMSAELAELFPNGCLHQVDMFSGELTELLEQANFLRHQPKKVIPSKQTAKSQLTDLRWARLGKAAGNQEKRRLRLLQRRKAAEGGEAADLESGPYEILSIAIAMHKRCEEDAEQGTVPQTGRKAAWFAYDFGPEGMRQTEGERWDGLPLGGSNYTSKYLENRYGNLDEKGEPCRPNWGELHELRRKQRESAKDDMRIRQKGREAWIRKKDGKAAKLEDKKKASEDKEEAMWKLETEKGWNEHDACLGMLSEYLVQHDITAEQDEEERRRRKSGKEESKKDEEREQGEKKDEEDIVIQLPVWEEFEEKQEQSWLLLPPKRRREILETARLDRLSGQTGGEVKKQKQEEGEVDLPI